MRAKRSWPRENVRALGSIAAEAALGPAGTETVW